MTTPLAPLAPLAEALTALGEVWAEASSAEALSRGELIQANDAIGLLRRRLDAVHAQVAAVIARESRSELGPDGLAKQQGFRSPTQLIAASTGTTAGDAARLVKVGEATSPRSTLTGEARPAKRPQVQRALAAGEIGAPAAAAIVSMLDRIGPRAEVGALDEAERMLVAQAPGLTADQLAKLITRAEAWLDPDGAEPREQELRARRSLTLFEREGMLHLAGVFDPESGAPIRAALAGYVTAQFQARADAVAPDAPDADHRSVPMMQADALTAFAEHVLGCDGSRLPLAGAQVIVRVDETALHSGAGTATIDGIGQPISIATARRAAASGGVIPWVCGVDGAILDFGRSRRLFTKAQKLALAERDGGCAMCALPPDLAKVHHLRWWQRDAGPTDLDNGILLCTSCHHRIHDNGWDIRIDGTGITAKVWFLPPPHVDPTRTPRLGGRARFDLVAA